MEYRIKEEDLDRCFKFAVDYHLDPSKATENRTTGQYRGLGGLISDFFIGKLIEIAVSSIIEKFTSKKIGLDFGVHKVTDDPDILVISEGSVQRRPRLFVEIKNTSEKDRWIGLTAEQFKTSLNSGIVAGDPGRFFMIGAELTSVFEKSRYDPLGVFLKRKLAGELLEKFAEPESMTVKIRHVLSGKELKKSGVAFNAGSYLYETDVFREANEKTAEKVLNPENRGVYRIVETKDNILPVIMRNQKPAPKEFGQFTCQGELEVYKKENPKSDRMYVNCRTDVRVSNAVLGEFDLDEGSVYETFFDTVGRDAVLKRNNVWIAQRNLENVSSMSAEDGIKFIAENI